MNPDSPRPPRRKRYSGRYPRRFEEKYKELRGDAETLAKVAASGKTPAGTHVPILLPEILEVLAVKPGEIAVDCTLGHGGHASALLKAVNPAAGGRLIALDVDPLELPRAEARLRNGFPDLPEGALTVRRSNFAGLPKVLAELGLSGVDALLADLGVSSMQIDNPARGFTFKADGPLDMRLNPERGESAAALLRRISPDKLAALLETNADEPHAAAIAAGLAGKEFSGTLALANAIRALVPPGRGPDAEEARELTVRRVFQALRIAVNDEFSALDTLLRALPNCLNPGGRVAILTFHSGEDRRVKHAFQRGLEDGVYAEISREVVRPGPEERRANPRSTSAKLRWAARAR